MNLNNLKENLYVHLNNISDTADKFPWSDKMQYAMFLRQTYSFVCHSTRLLCLTAANTDHQGFHNRFLDHALEEKSHEKLLEKDFRSLGVDLHSLPELLPTKGVYQTQYYWIEHVHPLSLFGYILLLEGLAVEAGKEVYQKTKAAHKDSACNFLRVHVVADEDHLPKAFQTLEECTPQELEIINEALDMTASFYHEFMKQIMTGAWKSAPATAA